MNSTLDLDTQPYVFPPVKDDDSKDDTQQMDLIVKDEEKPWGLLCSKNDQSSENKKLAGDSLTIGRSTSCNIVLADKRLSQKHCRIFQEKDKEGNTTIMVQDLSSNGTYLNEKKIGKNLSAKLENFDQIFLLRAMDVGPENLIGFTFTLTSLLTASQDDESNKKRKLEDVPKSEEKKEDIEAIEKRKKANERMWEEMKCIICTEFMYQPVTLMPCLHNFCGACYSDWLAKSKECPGCRAEVNTVKKNVTLNNFIESYLEAHPDEKQDEEIYKDMSSRNKITVDGFVVTPHQDTKKGAESSQKSSLAPPKEEKKQKPILPTGRKTRNTAGSSLVRQADSSSESFNSEGSGSDEEEKKSQPATGSSLIGTTVNGWSTTLSRNSTTATTVVRAVVPAGKVCMNCSKKGSTKVSTLMGCTFCQRAFCNITSKCPRGSNNLFTFAEQHKFPDLNATSFNGNTIEQNILRDYARNKKKILVSGLYLEMLDKSSKDNWNIAHRGTMANLSRKSLVCRECVDALWDDLAYRYRESITKALPANIRSKPDCWYGRNCRTQIHNLQHSQKLNHVCNQNK